MMIFGNRRREGEEESSLKHVEASTVSEEWFTPCTCVDHFHVEEDSLKTTLSRSNLVLDVSQRFLRPVF